MEDLRTIATIAPGSVAMFDCATNANLNAFRKRPFNRRAPAAVLRDRHQRCN